MSLTALLTLPALVIHNLTSPKAPAPKTFPTA